MLSSVTGQEKELKGKILEKRKKPQLFSDDIIIYLENLQKTCRNNKQVWQVIVAVRRVRMGSNILIDWQKHGLKVGSQ
jgi:hypothetical protein